MGVRRSCSLCAAFFCAALLTACPLSGQADQARIYSPGDIGLWVREEEKPRSYGGHLRHHSDGLITDGVPSADLTGLKRLWRKGL